MLPIEISCDGGYVRVEAEPGEPIRLSVLGPPAGVKLTPEAVQLLLAALVVGRRAAHGLPLARSSRPD